MRSPGVGADDGAPHDPKIRTGDDLYEPGSLSYRTRFGDAAELLHTHSELITEQGACIELARPKRRHLRVGEHGMGYEAIRRVGGRTLEHLLV